MASAGWAAAGCERCGAKLLACGVALRACADCGQVFGLCARCDARSLLGQCGSCAVLRLPVTWASAAASAPLTWGTIVPTVSAR